MYRATDKIIKSANIINKIKKKSGTHGGSRTPDDRLGLNLKYPHSMALSIGYDRDGAGGTNPRTFHPKDSGFMPRSSSTELRRCVWRERRDSNPRPMA